MTQSLMEGYKDQRETLERLLKVVGNNPQSWASLSKDIGIGYNTLRKFLDGHNTLRFKAYTRIVNYIEWKEQDGI